MEPEIQASAWCLATFLTRWEDSRLRVIQREDHTLATRAGAQPSCTHIHTPAAQGSQCTDTHTGTDLPAPGRQSWVPSDPALEVELTLTVPAEVDGAGSDMDVHEVIDDATLDVVRDAVHHVALPHVHDLDVGQVPFPKEGRERPVSGPGATGAHPASHGNWPRSLAPPPTRRAGAAHVTGVRRGRRGTCDAHTGPREVLGTCRAPERRQTSKVRGRPGHSVTPASAGPLSSTSHLSAHCLCEVDKSHFFQD